MDEENFLERLDRVADLDAIRAGIAAFEALEEDLKAAGVEPQDIEGLSIGQVLDLLKQKNEENQSGDRNAVELPDSHIFDMTKPKGFIFSDGGATLKRKDEKAEAADLAAGLAAEIVTDEKRGIKTFAQITREGDGAMSIEMHNPLTPYDGRVYEAYMSIAQMWIKDGYRPPRIPVSKILETMEGGGDSWRGSTKRREDVLNSIRKQQITKLTIDFRTTAQAYGEDVNPNTAKLFRREGALLPVFIDTKEYADGRVETYIVTLGESPLWTFSRFVNQIGTTPLRLLNVPAGKGERGRLITAYLAQEVARMKNAQKRKKKDRYIYERSYEEIFRASGAGLNLSRTQLSRERDTIHKVLQAWTKEGYINGFEALGKTKDREDLLIIRCDSRGEIKRLGKGTYHKIRFKV